MTLARTDTERLELVACEVRPLAWDEVKEPLAGGLFAVRKEVSERLPDRPPRLTATTMDQIPWGSIEETARAEARRRLGWAPGIREALGHGKRRRGRPPISTERILDAAARYVEKWESGSPSPTSDVADELGKRPTDVNRWLDRAVARGLFERTGGPGRPGGRLTPAGHQLLGH